MRALRLVASTCVFVALGCGSSVPAKPARVAVGAPSKPAPSSKPNPRLAKPPLPASPHAPGGESNVADLPHLCSGAGKDCYPPEDFVRLLCQKKYAGVAVKMFEKTAPWQHGYIKVKDVLAHNSHGGPNANTRLEFLEEVVVLRERPNRYREMVADLPTSYDVFRFDGTCATLAEDEFMTKKPVLPPRYAPFVWSQIDPVIRRALAQDPKVEKARLAQADLCHGSILTGGSGACRDATQQLARAILRVSVNGSPLPLPGELPQWPSIPDPRVRADSTPLP